MNKAQCWSTAGPSDDPDPAASAQRHQQALIVLMRHAAPPSFLSEISIPYRGHLLRVVRSGKITGVSLQCTVRVPSRCEYILYSEDLTPRRFQNPISRPLARTCQLLLHGPYVSQSRLRNEMPLQAARLAHTTVCS